MSPLILIGVAAAGLLALAGGKGETMKRPSEPGVPEPPPQIMAKITGAYNAADPTQLLAVAAEIEAQWPIQAASLREMAALIKATVAAKVPVPPAAAPKPTTSPTQVATVPQAVPALPIPDAKSPGWPPIAPILSAPNLAVPGEPKPAPANPLKVQAGAVALMLRNSRKGSEDREQVKAYQLANPETGKADGLYGPKSATVLALKFDIVPPKPFYWPVNIGPAKTAYNSMLMQQAMKDPPRFDEWVAAKVK